MDSKPRQRAEDLLADCQAARKAGGDFPSIWQGVLKKHPLIVGLPVQVILGDKPALSIQLLEGRHLFFGEDGFSPG
jgi:hypothetical protein